MMINRRFKTDINRHGETICGWSDLPVSDSHACQGKAKEETA